MKKLTFETVQAYMIISLDGEIVGKIHRSGFKTNSETEIAYNLREGIYKRNNSFLGMNTLLQFVQEMKEYIKNNKVELFPPY